MVRPFSSAKPRNFACFEGRWRLHAAASRVGKPYAYEPIVEAQLLVSGDPGATRADGRHALALPEAISETCTHRQHHRVLVFTDASLEIPHDGLPWPGASYVNLVETRPTAQTRASAACAAIPAPPSTSHREPCTRRRVAGERAHRSYRRRS